MADPRLDGSTPSLTRWNPVRGWRREQVTRCRGVVPALPADARQVPVNESLPQALHSAAMPGLLQRHAGGIAETEIAPLLPVPAHAREHSAVWPDRQAGTQGEAGKRPRPERADHHPARKGVLGDKPTPTVKEDGPAEPHPGPAQAPEVPAEHGEQRVGAETHGRPAAREPVRLTDAVEIAKDSSIGVLAEHPPVLSGIETRATHHRLCDPCVHEPIEPRSREQDTVW